MIKTFLFEMAQSQARPFGDGASWYWSYTGISQEGPWQGPLGALQQARTMALEPCGRKVEGAEEVRFGDLSL